MYKNAEKSKNSRLRKENWQKFIEPDYAVSRQGESFPEILSRYISEMQEYYNIKQKDISDATGIESSLITKYKHGRQKPTLYAIILLSLAMKLTPERSTHLLRAAGFVLNDSKEHRIYKLFLQGCAFGEDYSIENCNELLLNNGFMKLSI
ncbi:MAG: helix-turn-helix transcriptional regulator [Clostridium sp.]|nr:helix-turn-helix transcriptional regulator [Clostridium sp.]